MNEFNFIEQYLIKNQGDSSVLLGIGDDAAIVRPRPDWDLCISSDMLLAGRHFFVDTKPEDLAHRSCRLIYPIWRRWGRCRSGCF